MLIKKCTFQNLDTPKIVTEEWRNKCWLKNVAIITHLSFNALDLLNYLLHTLVFQLSSAQSLHISFTLANLYFSCLFSKYFFLFVYVFLVYFLSTKLHIASHFSVLCVNKVSLFQAHFKDQLFQEAFPKSFSLFLSAHGNLPLTNPLSCENYLCLFCPIAQWKRVFERKANHSRNVK